MRKNLIAAAVATSFAGFTGIAQAAEFEVTVTNVTAGIYFTPLIVAAHTPDAHMFVTGGHASEQLRTIAEGGNVAGMAALLESIGASVATGSGLLTPGASETFTIETSDTNSVMSLTGMLLPTNDGFVGLDSVYFPTSAGESVTFRANAYDAGTEANDELVGSGAPGEAGFPVPPPLAATGLIGSGGTGIHVEAEGFITPHRGVIGDLDSTGGFSDIDAAIHRWADPVALVTVTMIGGADDSVSAVSDLHAIAYSRSALEIFWEPATSADAAITSYEIKRNGELVATLDGLSFFEEGLDAATEYTYNVRAIDANGNAGAYETVVVSTNGG